MGDHCSVEILVLLWLFWTKNNFQDWFVFLVVSFYLSYGFVHNFLIVLSFFLFSWSVAQSLPRRLFLFLFCPWLWFSEGTRVRQMRTRIFLKRKLLHVFLREWRTCTLRIRQALWRCVWKGCPNKLVFDKFSGSWQGSTFFCNGGLVSVVWRVVSIFYRLDIVHKLSDF